MVGIYKITNKNNNKIYIGQSINIEERWKKHIYSPSNSLIHQAIVKYGVQSFAFEILEECASEQLNEREKYWIAYYNSVIPFGYNKTEGGDSANLDENTRYQKLDSEKVDQIILLLKNSTLTEREIANIFNVSEDFISYINLGRNHRRINIDYPIRKVKFRPKQCTQCGAPISGAGISGLCVSCSSAQRRTVIRPEKETLLQELLSTSFTAVGKKYGVSDNAIRKWCKSYGLPTTKKELKNLEKI